MSFEKFLQDTIGEFGVFQISLLIICVFSTSFSAEAILHNFFLGDQVK